MLRFLEPASVIPSTRQRILNIDHIIAVKHAFGSQDEPCNFHMSDGSICWAKKGIFEVVKELENIAAMSPERNVVRHAFESEEE